MKTKTKNKVNIYKRKYKTLNKIDIPQKTKAKLRAEARKWLDFIRAERGEICGEDSGQDGHYQYHSGEINFIELFFNLNEINARKK